MEMHSKFRLEILIDAPIKKSLIALLDREEVSGYTVFPALGGRGQEMDWSRAGLVNDVGKMLLFVCILDEERRDRVLEAVKAELIEHIGYVASTQVDVLRPAKFP